MWVREYGEDGVYVSFSGGKDSTVLLDIVRNRCGYTEIPAVFVDTGLEYPEIREFVKTFDNVTWLKPRLQFRRVIEKFGYPFISKEVSEKAYYAQKYFDWVVNGKQDGRPTPYSACELVGIKRKTILYRKCCDGDDEELISRIFDSNSDAPFKAKCLTGTVGHKEKGVETNEISKVFDFSKYRFLISCPYPLSSHCCNVMKKSPMHKYSKESKRYCMTAEMANESRLRTQKWLQNGCNGFHLKEPKSTPMAFWTEQDVLQYIKENNVTIAPVYGNIVYDELASEQLEGQLEFAQDGIQEAKCALKTTGCNRTGCMFCGFGCHLEKEGEGRFEKMKETHPKQYEWIMRDWDKGGLGYKNVIDWINEHGNLNIRY